MRKHLIALTAGLALAAGCVDKTIVYPEGTPTVDALAGDLTAAGVQTLALGVLAADRALVRGDLTYLTLTAIYARDAYRIDPNEPRYVSETLGGQPDPGSFAGGGGWTNGFVAIRAANSLLAALPAALETQVSPAEKSATAGLVQTIKALDYYRLLELRDTIGLPIQRQSTDTVPPISCKKDVMNYIGAVLDSGLVSLTAAGTTQLPFAPPSGFTAFGRNYRLPANLILLNRGLKGKLDVYRGLQRPTPTAGALTAAITELTQALGGAAPGAVPASTFANGAYVTFVPTGTEGAANPLADARVGVNPKAQAALQAGDTRASKIVTRSSLAGQGLSTTITYIGTPVSATNQSRPVAILRDEELVLLRAQAYIETNQLANATADLNSVRTAYGLAPYAVFADQASARTALLYEKRFSLFFEGPQRLVDLRAYGLLKAPATPAELSGDPYNSAFPIPKAEADARGGTAKLTLACT
ncbi:MAG TPA: RagB/SusD family nutrient uptake outer membrane protein [Gemmatimonadaceae bacterium]|nr:RagB/SusD family nutrient uptake outer membrane protein [Gemmatimonadaceae bacterium]